MPAPPCVLEPSNEPGPGAGGMSMKFRCAAFLSTLAFAPAAYATDWYTGAPGEPAPRAASIGAGGADGWSAGYSGQSYSAQTAPKFGVAIDAAVTADTKDSRFATLIGTIAPFSGFEQSGARLRLSGVLGQYSYIGGNGVGRVKGTQRDGSFMVGYEWVSERLTVAVYGGVNISDNQLDKVDPLNGSSGRAMGAKIASDFYYRPNAFVMMSGVGSFSSAHSAYYARLKGGYAIARNVFVGPELIVLGDNFFSQWRIGGHITGAKFGPLQVGASAGLLVDKVRGTGLYGILDARLAF